MTQTKYNGNREEKQPNQIGYGDVSAFGTRLIRCGASSEYVKEESFQKLVFSLFFISTQIS